MAAPGSPAHGVMPGGAPARSPTALESGGRKPPRYASTCGDCQQLAPGCCGRPEERSAHMAQADRDTGQAGPGFPGIEAEAG